MTDKAARAALLTAKGMDKTSENIADYVADLLRQGRAKEITDDLMEQADPQRLMHHYKSGNTGMDLPMDKASRMARAKGMGFDTKAYHATSANFPAFDPLKRGTSTDAGWFGDADYFSPSPQYASKFIAGGHEGSNIIPAIIKTGKVYDWRKMEESRNGLGLGNNKDAALAARKRMQDSGYNSVAVTNDILKTDDHIPDDLWQRMTEVEPSVEKLGRENVSRSFMAGIPRKSLEPYYSSQFLDLLPVQKSVDETAVFDPNQSRSQFARFDPRLDHLAHLNASTGGAMDFARHVEAVQRAGGQIAPSKYLPNVPRQVHADGGRENGKRDFTRDNPGGEWLEGKQARAAQHPDMKFMTGSITGVIGGRSNMFLPTHILKGIAGLNDEVRTEGVHKYDSLLAGAQKGGFDPDQEGNKVVVGVNHYGQPYLLEGNTRVAVAHAMGVPKVKAEVRYWNGAEEADGPMHPDHVFDMASDSPDITKAEGGSVTDSDEFRNWFGNSVTHTDGDPHVFYTGTSKDKDFTSFNVGRHGAWFTRDPAEASQYAEQNDSQGYKHEAGWKLTPTNTAGRVIPAYVKAENPYTGDLPDEVLRSNYKAAQSDWFDTLRRKGHDAWVPARYNGDLVVALKEPQQIKSIFNNGKFDPNQKHMNKAGGGEVDGEDDGITAYHGSPHSFDQFDISKLGTGEGNQAYGHGLYFAGNENIAKHYRDTLTSGLNSYTVDDVPASKLHGSLDPANSLKMNYAQQIREGKSHENAINFLKAQYNGKMTSRFAYPEDIPYHKAQLDRLEEMRANPPKVQHLSGHMYKVKINAGPHELLDWDKPLSEQHPAVKAAIKATGINVSPTKWENNADLGDGLRLIVTPHPDLPDEEEFTKYRMQLPNGRSVPMSRNDVTRMLGDQSDPEGIRGSEIYRRLTQAGNKEHISTGNLAGRGDQWASEKLRSVGIKGLRYLDAGSRAKDIDGDPTHNYVMFHHDPVQVVDKYEYGGMVGKEEGGATGSLREKSLWPSAQAIKAGTGSREAHEALVNKIKPVSPYATPVPPASDQQVHDALTKDKQPKAFAPRQLKEGTPVAVRLDIPAYEKRNTWVVSVHHPKSDFTAGEVIGYDSVAHIDNPRFGVHPTGALNIASGKPKATIATVHGNWKKTTPEDAFKLSQTIHNDPQWRQVGMDPERHSYFYDRETQEPIMAADEALHIGPLVYAKNPVYGKKTDFSFSSGGDVSAALALTRRFTKDGTGATMALKPKGK